MAATLLAAQTPSEPNIVLTLYAGYGSGHQLSQIARQTLIFGNSTMNPPDTVSLTRQLNSSLVIGATLQLFRSANWGFFGDMGFRPLSFDDSCAPAAPFQADAPQRNRTLCDNITAGNPGGSLVTFSVGGIARIAPSAGISPYLRGGVTAAYVAASSRALAAPESNGGLQRVVIRDDAPGTWAVSVTFAAGLNMPLAPGYRFRLELRDHLARLETVTGPANSAAMAPFETRAFHQIALLLGYDVVLEQKRVRRY